MRRRGQSQQPCPGHNTGLRHLGDGHHEAVPARTNSLPKCTSCTIGVSRQADGLEPGAGAVNTASST